MYSYKIVQNQLYRDWDSTEFRVCPNGAFELARYVQYVIAEWEPAFLRQAREFPFFPLLPREASK